MYKRGWMVALVVALVAALPAPGAMAITNGKSDEGRHPYVGALVSYDPATGEKYLICTGTLVAPTVFLTAAHCLLDEPSDLYVSFDSFVGAPDVGPDVKLYHGNAIGHPEFEDETAPGDTHDIAVVVLDERVRGIKPALLPRRNLLDSLAKHDLIDRIRYGVVGYGREGFDGESFFGGGSRRFAFSPFASLESHKLNLSQTGEQGGTCRGDSGGPVFIGRTRVVVGIVSDGDPHCVESSVNYRTDTRSARTFLAPILKAAKKHDDDDDEDDDDD